MTDALDVAATALHHMQSRPLLVCIDGPAGSGKTTLAQHLAQRYAHAAVIHMDDVYEGWDEPLNAELIQRVRTHIVLPFQARRLISFQQWDWVAERWGDAVAMPAPEILILEGVGSAARGLREHAQLTIFLEIDDAIGAQRVHERDGAGVVAHMQSWIQHQRHYFESDETRANCDLTIAAAV